MKALNSLKLLVAAVVVGVFSACTPVMFESPVPEQSRTVEQFPVEYRGTYVSNTDETTETLIIDENSYSCGEIVGVLGENAVLKPYQEFWVMNQKAQDSNDYLVFLGKFDLKKGEVEIRYLNLASDEERVAKLKAITEVREEFNEEGEREIVFISPTDQEFKKMLEEDLFITYGVFKKQ
jgi:hypothetical protein